MPQALIILLVIATILLFLVAVDYFKSNKSLTLASRIRLQVALIFIVVVLFVHFFA